MATLLDGIIDEAKRLFVDTEYTCRGQWAAARRWENIHQWAGGLSATLAAGGGIVTMLNNPFYGAALGFLSAATIGFVTVWKPLEKAKMHSAAGAWANDLNGRLRHFARNQAPHMDSGDADAKLTELRQEKRRLNIESPPIPRRAYLHAKRGIEAGESGYSPDFQRLSHDWAEKTP